MIERSKQIEISLLNEEMTSYLQNWCIGLNLPSRIKKCKQICDVKRCKNDYRIQKKIQGEFLTNRISLPYINNDNQHKYKAHDLFQFYPTKSLKKMQIYKKSLETIKDYSTPNKQYFDKQIENTVRINKLTTEGKCKRNTQLLKLKIKNGKVNNIPQQIISNSQRIQTIIQRSKSKLLLNRKQLFI